MTRDELDQFIKSLDYQDDALERWERMKPKPEPPRRERGPTVAELEQLRAAEWDAWVQGHIKRQHEFMIDVLGAALGEVRAELVAKIAEEVGSLRAELHVQRAHADHAGQVIDLPAFPLRRGRHAA